jgi:hypothetical protein
MKLVTKCALFGVAMLAMHILTWVVFEQDDIGRPYPEWARFLARNADHVLRPVEDLIEHVHSSAVDILNGGVIPGGFFSALDFLVFLFILVVFWGMLGFCVVSARRWLFGKNVIEPADDPA